MPTYSYRCSACANEFEQFQKFTEDPLTDCPACGGSVRRVIQPVGVVFKGTGWYITDNRKSNGSDSPTAEKPAKSEKPAKDGDSDSKPAKKETLAAPA
ncbi:MAG: FmdB family zinc ribbon protein [Thermomicrobiales bacterium]